MCVRNIGVSMSTNFPSTSDLAVCDTASTEGWQSCGASYVAVYGTLRSGGSNDMAYLRPLIRSVGRTVLQGSLFDLGWYPGLVLDGQRPVVAEIYPLDPALEVQLDRIEGLWPTDVGEYTKRIVQMPIRDADGQESLVDVLVYEAMPEAVSNAPQIAANDWLAWFAGRGLQHPDSLASRSRHGQNKK